ncbi:hypothetical protein BCR33DRAFT_748080 [Rhizoclosmatium globosum]|uniref:Uncharacterized protein n=1 Tax=Rhizoclosmatium globosum TaxID=329046 RepID=A0A1Y2ANP4_9FUNG|nr:hypothetical protein BCR33DRAFT_748080 [Rhizoclosmatium globosum]|eukprot:ORY24104.1 hypothetical protein BCR33DRAFT_748080 [Rhizoclosmatium globosum]
MRAKLVETISSFHSIQSKLKMLQQLSTRLGFPSVEALRATRPATTVEEFLTEQGQHLLLHNLAKVRGYDSVISLLNSRSDIPLKETVFEAHSELGKKSYEKQADNTWGQQIANMSNEAKRSLQGRVMGLRSLPEFPHKRKLEAAVSAGNLEEFLDPTIAKELNHALGNRLTESLPHDHFSSNNQKARIHDRFNEGMGFSESLHGQTVQIRYIAKNGYYISLFWEHDCSNHTLELLIRKQNLDGHDSACVLFLEAGLALVLVGTVHQIGSPLP